MLTSAAVSALDTLPSGGPVALDVNGTVVSTQPMRANPSDGSVVITGSTAGPFTKSQADQLAQLIDRSKFPPPLLSTPGTKA